MRWIAPLLAALSLAGTAQAAEPSVPVVTTGRPVADAVRADLSVGAPPVGGSELCHSRFLGSGG